ncbi:MAG TPA: hypothetical protein VK039_05430, partial [Brevibacterium sp.]|nr:hypothetical protein [Brevibacterium sp.]
ELIEKPATAFAATFMGTPPANVIDGVVRAGRLMLGGVDVGGAPAGVVEQVDAGGPSGEAPVRALYRSGSLALVQAGSPRREPGAPSGEPAAPSDAHVREGRRVLPGTLVDQVPMAERWVVGVDLADGTRVHVTMDEPCDAATGESVAVQLPAAPEVLFDEAGERIPGTGSGGSADAEGSR